MVIRFLLFHLRFKWTVPVNKNKTSGGGMEKMVGQSDFVQRQWHQRKEILYRLGHDNNWEFR
jgi:hypothetical protein